MVASVDTDRPISGLLKVTKCSNETLEARAGRAGFEIAFDPTDCAKCGDWRMVAQPEDESFLWTTYRISCDSAQPIVVRCPSKSRVLREIDNAIAAADWGRATLISSDLHARAGEPRALEAYKDASAEFFSVPREMAWKKDVQQGKEVATPVLVEKIKAFQKETGLRSTGVIDFPTAVKMAVEGGATSGVGSAPLYREIVR
jgi:hypothetical protein